MKSDFVITILLSLVIFLFFNLVDAFENIYHLTREHEEYEIDELFLLLLSFPIPLAWFAFRRALEEKKSVKERILLEKNLAHAQKLESLGTLAGGVAHEINNQLLPIITMAELIEKNIDQSDVNRRKIELILAAANNAKNTISKIKTFSRADNQLSSHCDISDVCQEIRELINITKPSNVTFSFQVDEIMGMVHLSADRLQGIIINMINNAFDALEGKIGEVSMRVNAIYVEEENKLPELVAGKYARIIINDSGIGMSSTVKEKIFDPFYTTKEVGQGVGLGMSAVYTSIKLAGGEVHVDSVEGEGTSIIAYLPLKKDE